MKDGCSSPATWGGERGYYAMVVRIMYYVCEPCEHVWHVTARLNPLSAVACQLCA